MTFRGGGGLEASCNLTLNGTLASGPIAATAGATIGSVSEVRISRCRFAISAVLRLPWSIKYQALIPAGEWFENEGLLLTIPSFAFNISAFGGCVNGLYAGEPAFALELVPTEGSGVFNAGLLISQEEVQLPKAPARCAPERTPHRRRVGLSPSQTVTIS